MSPGGTFTHFHPFSSIQVQNVLGIKYKMVSSTKRTWYFQKVRNVLGRSTFCLRIKENALYPRKHDLGLTALLLIQVHNSGTKVKKCTGLRSRTHFSG